MQGPFSLHFPSPNFLKIGNIRRCIPHVAQALSKDSSLSLYSHLHHLHAAGLPTTPCLSHDRNQKLYLLPCILFTHTVICFSVAYPSAALGTSSQMSLFL